MNDIERRNDYPSASSLSKLGITAIGYTAGGILLFILIGASRFGFVAGGVVCLIGIISIMSKDPADRKAGFLIAAAGVLSLFSKIPGIAPVAGTLMSIGAIGLLAMGILNGIKFFIGLKKRS